MGLDLTTFDDAMKEHYTQDMVENMSYKDNPLFAMIPKMEKFGGKNLPVPIIFGNPQGRSKTFAKAQARSLLTNSRVAAFALTRVSDYSIAVIDNEVMEASEDNQDAFMEAATTEIDGALDALTRSVAIGIYGGVDANYGQISVEPTVADPAVLTMKNVEDITNIEVGQKLVFFAAKSGGTAKLFATGVSSAVVVSVDRVDGTFTMDEAYDANGTLAADDYVFVDGDRGLGISGLADWVPATDPGATAFFGVDRSQDVTRLGGIRYDGSDKPIEEALILAASLTAREGGKPDYCFLPYSNYADLELALGSKVQYIDLKVNAEVGFRGIQINGPRGPIRVIADQNATAGVAYMLSLKFWKLYSLKKPVRIIDSDGTQKLRQASADGIEVRCTFKGNVGCRAPGYNCRVALV